MTFGRCDVPSSTTFGRKTMTWQFRPNVVPDCFFRPNVVLGGMSHRPKVVCDELSYRRNGFRRIVVHPCLTADQGGSEFDPGPVRYLCED